MLLGSDLAIRGTPRSNRPSPSLWVFVLIQHDRNSKVRNCSRSNAKRIAVAGLRNLYDLLRNNFRYGIGAVHESKDTQCVRIGRRHALNFVRPERRILQ
jgi:hypothetical protein